MIDAALPPQQFHAQVRVGRISSVSASGHTAQVNFFEGDQDSVTFDLQIVFTRPGDYSLFAKDTPVLCLMMDGTRGVGFVIGAIYTEDDPPPLDDEGARSIAGDDIRLGDPEAEDKIALAPLVKSELDKIKTELNKISTTLASLTGQASFTTPYTMGYSPTEPAAENVSAK